MNFFQENNKLSFFFQLAIDKKTQKRAILVAIIVGLILNLINNWIFIISFSFHELNISTIILTFIVPYCVSTYSSVLSKGKNIPGDISRINGLIRCINCKGYKTSLFIGELIEECPNCKSKTKWKVQEIKSFIHSEDSALVNLALMNKNNPQPFFSINKEGIIIDSNHTSSEVLKKGNINRLLLSRFIPELNQLNIKELIAKNTIKIILVQLNYNYYNLTLKGISEQGKLHIYGNNITQLVFAENKIKRQTRYIKESIAYAGRIQKAMLPNLTFIESLFPEHFIFYRSREIVSGDFYWGAIKDHYKIIAVGDCTGHGIPGAFMSMLAISLLNEIIHRENITEPDIILNNLRDRIIKSLSAKQTGYNFSDGLDISLIVIDSRKNNLNFAGAFHPLVIFRNNDIIIIKGDRMPVGKYIDDQKPFNSQKIDLKIDDWIYLYTDGYRDQVGHKIDKKYTLRAFNNLLRKIGPMTPDEQLSVLTESFDSWKGNIEQVDDVLVMGLKISKT